MLTLLVVVAGIFGLAALLAFISPLWEENDDGAVDHAEESPEPTPLVKGRGLGQLALNVFPAQHDRPCSCNARALVWVKDSHRHDAWTGYCRRCGLARLDVMAGMTVEL